MSRVAVLSPSEYRAAECRAQNQRGVRIIGLGFGVGASVQAIGAGHMRKNAGEEGRERTQTHT